jgi:hypothetical protein
MSKGNYLKATVRKLTEKNKTERKREYGKRSVFSFVL